ncbi:MAG: polysaccharide biosynthesis/export family protein [Planctomycetaceae bacterium]|nr:polysaccharide biosynthesis/export family protein [Planctomycetaceae bacterium]
MCRGRDCHRSVLVLLTGALLAGCSPPGDVAPFIDRPRRAVTGIEYRVLPPDILLIRSAHIQEINNVQQQIRPDGKINLPLIGEVDAAGRTAKEIEEDINRGARKYYDEVDATVEVALYNSQKYYVFGQVIRPGGFPWTGHDTVLEALAQSMPNFEAWPEQIILVRGAPPQTGGYAEVKAVVDKTPTARNPQKIKEGAHKVVINLYAMIKEGDMTNNVFLRPNDMIYVRPNPLAEVGLAVQSMLLPVRPAVEMVTTPATVTTTK